MRPLSELIVLVKGGGEVASALAHSLHRRHCRVCPTEVARPLAVCRGTTFSEAVFDGDKTIEGVTAELTQASVAEISRVWQRQNIAIIIDPEASLKDQLKPDVFIDATMAKKSTGTKITDAPLVIGLGVGFYAGRDVHIVIETNHSDNLGRIILEGEAEKNTGTPVAVGGLTRERVIWAPRAGVFTSKLQIGDRVSVGQTLGTIDGTDLVAPVGGMLRGLMRSGVGVTGGAKLIEIDPVNDSAVCHLIRYKMRVVASSVLQAIMMAGNGAKAC